MHIILKMYLYTYLCIIFLRTAIRTHIGTFGDVSSLGPLQYWDALYPRRSILFNRSSFTVIWSTLGPF